VLRELETLDFAMDTSAQNDPSRLLFACEHCNFWPMAYQSERSWGAEAAFSCPRCKSLSLFNIRQTVRTLREHVEAQAGERR
jgi:hypothetical protein